MNTGTAQMTHSPLGAADRERSCMDCPVRYPACHDRCPAYLERRRKAAFIAKCRRTEGEVCRGIAMDKYKLWKKSRKK